jgi:hypothetical protein
LSARAENDPLENETNQKIADVLRDAARTPFDNNPALVHRVFLAVKNSAYVKRDWWLSWPLLVPERNDNNQIGAKFSSFNLPIEFQTEVIRRAVDTLEDEGASLSLVAQSCMILAKGGEINDEQRLRILKAIDHRLESTGTREEALTAMVPVAEEFRALALPGIGVNRSPRRALSITLSHDPLAASPVLEMLDVADSLHGAATVQNGLVVIKDGLQATLQLIVEGREGNIHGVRLNWPKLTFQEPQSSIDMSKEVWGTHEPTSTDWLKYCIIHHPVLEQYLADHPDDPANN